jgi:hypothetical protein
MALTEETEIFTRVLPIGTIEVETHTVIKRDGVEIGREKHNHVITPLVSVGDLANQPQEVKDIASVIHTQAKKDAYTALMASPEV